MGAEARETLSMQSLGRSLSDVPTKGGQLVTARTVAIFRYACPYCAAELTQQDGALFCTREGRRFRQLDGIWRLLRHERQEQVQEFATGYTHVRGAEGWGAPTRDYCLGLPFRDSSRRHRGIWRVRAAAYHMLERVLAREFIDRPVRALDLGAGNCWLTRRLSARGYAACAVDIRTDTVDGLSAGQVYRDALGSPCERVQAELECLPFVGRQFEVVIANAALHYTESLDVALDEACRVLAPGGIIVIMDSPFYHDGTSGAQMLQDRRREYLEWLALDPALSERQIGYFIYADFPHRLERHGLEAYFYHPFVGLRWWLRPTYARLCRRREPASFPLVLCRRSSEE
jgi:SAM-dependent methyltransferase